MNKIIFFITFLNFTIFGQWAEQTVTPRPSSINSVYSYSSDIGYAAADSGKFLWTTNAGLLWNVNTVPQFSPNSVNCMQAPAQNLLFCICNAPGNGRVFRSTDAGATWILNYNRVGGVFYDVKFVNPNTGFVYGQPTSLLWFIARTTNGGLTWDSTTVTRPLADNPFDLGFPNSMFLLLNAQVNIWFCTSTGKIFYSPNGAFNWTFGITQPGQPVFSVSFVDQQTGYSGGGNAFRTTNSGTFWQQQPYPITGPINSFVNSTGRIWYSSGLSIYTSTNGGLNFFLQHTSPGSAPYKQLSMTFSASDNQMSVLTGWGVTGDGVISRYTETVGIQQIGTEIPETFKLDQNYPNPFNPVTHFGFRIADHGFVSIKIYNALGENVSTIVNNELQPGIYQAEWDASNYPSGIYYYKLAAGNYSETKKMILVK
jgi:photosystem II stability/assembly factor-like uncharacterized protein